MRIDGKLMDAEWTAVHLASDQLKVRADLRGRSFLLGKRGWQDTVLLIALLMRTGDPLARVWRERRS